MAAPVVYAPIGSKSLPLCYSHNALFRLQKESGKSPQLLQMLLIAGRGGPVETTQILWAGLEGGRLKTNGRPVPYTIDEVGDLIDEAGGSEEISEPTHPLAIAVLEAWTGAFPITKRLNEEAAAREKAAAAAGNPTEAGASETPAPGLTGTTS